MTDRYAGGDNTSWFEAWRLWTASFARSAHNPNVEDAARRMHAGAGFGRAYVDFANALLKSMGSSSPTEFSAQLVAVLERIAGTGSNAAQSDAIINVFAAAAPELLLASMPNANSIEYWRRFGATLSTWTEGLLAIPSLGPMREWSEQSKAVQRAFTAERDAATAVLRHYRQALEQALRDLAALLRSADASPITSVRALYDVWITQAEQAYATTVMTDEFAQDFGRWINATSKLRISVRALSEHLGATLGLPQRAEIDELIARQHALQLTIASLRAEADKKPLTAPLIHSLGPAPAVTANGRAKRKVVPSPPAAIARGPSTARKPSRAQSAGKPARKGPGGEFDIARFTTRDD